MDAAPFTTAMASAGQWRAHLLPDPSVGGQGHQAQPAAAVLGVAGRQHRPQRASYKVRQQAATALGFAAGAEIGDTQLRQRVAHQL